VGAHTHIRTCTCGESSHAAISDELARLLRGTAPGVYVADAQPVVERSYDLAKLANLQPGVRIRLGNIAARKAAERAYASAAKIMLRELRAAIARDVIPNYGRRSALITDTAMTTDAVADWFLVFTGMRERVTAAALRRIRGIMRGESRRHTKRWRAVINAQINVDLTNVVRDEALENYLEAVALRQAGLITSIYDDTVRAVANLTQQAVLGNASVNDLRKQIQERLRISTTRANLIARDQVATLTSELNHIRQEQAGVLKYEWSTNRDGRERDLHAEYDGNTYTWKKPPKDGHPGVAILCRCSAIGILEV